MTDNPPKYRVRVYHTGYGCESGCCGHTVEVYDTKTQETVGESFEFDHPWDDKSDEARKEWARSLAENLIREEHPECLPSIDWSTLEWDRVGC